MEEIAKQLMVILTSALVLFIVAIFPFGLQHLYTNIIALRLHAGTDVSSSISLLLPYLLRQPVLLVIMIAGIALSFVKRTNLKFPNILILIWSLFALAQLVLYRPLFPHHLSIVAIPFMLLFVLNIDNFSIKKFERQYQKVVPILVLASSLYIVILLSIQPTTLLTHTQQSTLKTIDSVTSPHDYVVTDEEILNVESGRLPPPELSDVSYVRIYSNNLSAQNFQSIIEKYKPKLIIPWNGRLASIQSLHLILEKYRPLQTIDSKTIYIFSP